MKIAEFFVKALFLTMLSGFLCGMIICCVKCASGTGLVRGISFIMALYFGTLFLSSLKTYFKN